MNNSYIIQCAHCKEELPSLNYLKYYVQKYNERQDSWFFVSRKKLLDLFGQDPNFPEEIKNSSLPYVPYCTRACIKHVIDYLNSTNTGIYRYNTKYSLIKTNKIKEE